MACIVSLNISAKLMLLMSILNFSATVYCKSVQEKIPLLKFCDNPVTELNIPFPENFVKVTLSVSSTSKFPFSSIACIDKLKFV